MLMPVLTRDHLRVLYDQISAQNGALNVDQQLNKRQGFRAFGQTTIFLSSYTCDMEMVKQVASFLYHLGFDLYIDWLDEIPSPSSTTVTAKKVKDKIKGLDKFILIATPDTLKANYSNWQLGFADAYKFPDRIAVLPIAEN